MKKITDHLVDGAEKQMEIKTADFPGPGGAHHIYECRFQELGNLSAHRIRFQKGPIKDVGVNGVSNEMLLAIVADRLRDFQAGKFSCPENEVALSHTLDALESLKKRTQDRLARSVEGTLQK